MGYRQQFWEQGYSPENEENEKLSLQNQRLTAKLKESISYEQSKSDVNNLLTHKRQDLSLMISIIDNERQALKYTIDSRQYMLDNAEDMEEGLEKQQREMQATERAKLETLLAWRILFLGAWTQAKQ